MPKLTQTWGVVMEPISGKTNQVLTREMEILRRFAYYLCQLRYFDQRFHPNLQNWLPFYWKGFTETSRTTYVLQNLNDRANLWRGMHQNTRRQISKAARAGIGVHSDNVDDLWNMVVKSFARQSRAVGYTENYLKRIYAAAIANNQGKCFVARDQEGRPHAASLLVWDKKRAYHLVVGVDPDLRSSYAGALLTWHLIQFAAERSSIFDFEGSMLEGVERFFRGFGAEQVGYHWVMNFPPWVQIYLRCTKTL